MTLTGGCHCGEIAYQVEEPALFTCYCHCHSCRLSIGASPVPWITFAVTGFTVTKGTPVWYRSSAKARRGFCGACGASLFFAADSRPKHIDITLTSLKDAANFPPKCHIYVEDKLPWITLNDGLPAYQRDTSSPLAEP